MQYKVGQFKKYIARCDISLGMVDPVNPPKIPGEQVFDFDGFSIRLKDGRVFEKAEGLQGMIEKGFVLLAKKESKVVKTVVHKPKKLKTKKAVQKSKESQEDKPALMSALDELDFWEEDLDEELEDEDEEDDFEDEEESEEDFEDEDEEWGLDDDEDDDFDEGVDLRDGISLRNQSRNVNSGRDLNEGQRWKSVEHSAKATVGSYANPVSTGGAYVGSGGGIREKTASFGGRENIQIEEAQVTRTVMQIPNTGIGNSRDNAERRNVSEMSMNSVTRMENSMADTKAIPVGEGRRIAAKLKKAEEVKARKVEKMIQKRSSLLEEIQERLPKFKWNLRADPQVRFEKAIEVYKKSKISAKSKKNLDAILEYELPDMRKRIEKEIEFHESPRRT